MYTEFNRGDLVWFDPGIGYVLPGEILEYHKQAQVSVQFTVSGQFTVCSQYCTMGP